MPEEPEQPANRPSIQETGRFTLTVGLDADGDQACIINWAGLDVYSVIGYLESCVMALKADTVSRWQHGST